MTCSRYGCSVDTENGYVVGKYRHTSQIRTTRTEGSDRLERRRMTNVIDRDVLRDLAPAGYYVALRVGFAFPLVEMNELPPAWVEQYTVNRFMLFDPVIQWVYSQTGAIRWSAIDRPDPRGVFRLAATHGLRFGVAISFVEGETDAQRSFGSFSRSDREYTIDEVEVLERSIQRLHRENAPPSNLTSAELEALRMISEGMRLKQIAFELGVTEGAVKQRLKNAKGKLGAQTGAQAASKARDFGLL